MQVGANGAETQQDGKQEHATESTSAGDELKSPPMINGFPKARTALHKVIRSAWLWDGS
jgi:hypothetical protein